MKCRTLKSDRKRRQLEFNIHMRVVDETFHMAPEEIVQRCQVWIGREGAVPWPPRSPDLTQFTSYQTKVFVFILRFFRRKGEQKSGKPMKSVLIFFYLVK
jgi:hypothetical protein